MKELLGVTYDEYVSADVVFVTVIKTVYREEAIADFVGIRPLANNV